MFNQLMIFCRVSITIHKNTIQKFLQYYSIRFSAYTEATLKTHENSVVCGFNTPAPEGKVCRVTMGQFGRCTSLNLYGYNSSQPCIFLKLNRVYLNTNSRKLTI